MKSFFKMYLYLLSRLYESHSVNGSSWIQMNTREVPRHTVGRNHTFWVFSSPPKQADMRHQTKRQQVHSEDVNPPNDTPITSNSTRPNSL